MLSYLSCYIILFIHYASSRDLFPSKDVIELPVGRFPEPNCKYSVHHQSKSGKLVLSKVEIGAEIYHSWSCAYDGNKKNDLFCVFVNNCTISNGENDRKIDIIDENGCTLFPTILPSISYDDDLSAGIQTHAFSLDADNTSIHFTCNIKFLLKDRDVCRRPICNNQGR